MQNIGMTDEKQFEILKLYEGLKNDMAYFGRFCFPTAIKKETPAFHKEVYKALNNRALRRILVGAPRGTAKSTIDSLVYPAHRIAFKERDEDIFIVIISESQAQAVNFLSRLKYHLSSSQTFHELFGNLGEATAVRWTNNDIVLANGARVLAIGTGQRLRGFIEKDVRPTDIIIDDFESEKNAATPEARTKNREWMQNAVIPSLDDGGRIVFVGTPISEDCFMYWARGDVKDDGDDKYRTPWHVLWYSICEDIDKLYSEPENKKNLLWPDKFPAERVKEIIAEYENLCNMHGFYQEYMCIAQDPATAPFKADWIKYHGGELVYKDKRPYLLFKRGGEQDYVPITIYHGVDPASSLSSTADYFVVATVGIDENDNKYVISITRGRFDPADQPDILLDVWDKMPGRRMKIETVAYQEALRSFLRKKLNETGKYIPGLESGVKSRTPKSERLFSLAPVMKAGRFYFRRDMDREAVSEFLSYPRGKHDDIMDAIWTALDGAKFVSHGGVYAETGKLEKKAIYSWKVA